jgi:hypothetical protein
VVGGHGGELGEDLGEASLVLAALVDGGDGRGGGDEERDAGADESGGVDGVDDGLSLPDAGQLGFHDLESGFGPGEALLEGGDGGFEGGDVGCGAHSDTSVAVM